MTYQFNMERNIAIVELVFPILKNVIDSCIFILVKKKIYDNLIKIFEVTPSQ